MTKTVVIVGSGFGGLQAALSLRKKSSDLKIVVINKFLKFFYCPSLQKLACGHVKKNSITINLKKLFKKHNIRFYHEEVIQVRPLQNIVVTNIRRINFDYLIIASGADVNFYQTEGVMENSFKLKNLLDAKKINMAVVEMLQKAKHYTNPPKIAVCEAGLTGVEIACELADRVKKKANIILLEDNHNILPGFSNEVKNYARTILKKKGVEIRNDCKITGCEDGKVHIKNKEPLFASIIIWCGGIKANKLNYKTSLRTSDKGLLMVNEFLQTNHPLIYAIGDCSYVYKNPQPTTALTALWQGELAAENIYADITKSEKKVFFQEDHPYIISLGKRKAIMINNKSLKKGFIPSIIKKMVKHKYLLAHKYNIGSLK